MIDLALDMLAAYRITRLVTSDVVLDRPRAAIIRAAYEWRDGSRSTIKMTPRDWEEKAIDDREAPKLAELIVCRWCVSAYAAALVVVMRRRFPRAWPPIAEGLALSSVAALLAGLEQ